MLKKVIDYIKHFCENNSKFTGILKLTIYFNQGGIREIKVNKEEKRILK
jgi:hypothetical protein